MKFKPARRRHSPAPHYSLMMAWEIRTAQRGTVGGMLRALEADMARKRREVERALSGIVAGVMRGYDELRTAGPPPPWVLEMLEQVRAARR